STLKSEVPARRGKTWRRGQCIDGRYSARQERKDDVCCMDFTSLHHSKGRPTQKVDGCTTRYYWPPMAHRSPTESELTHTPSKPPGLDTGDLLLFDRPCAKIRGAFGSVVCAGAKLLSSSPWDHIGVIVRDEDGTNLLVEASFGGIKVRPVMERVARSSATQICIRRLQAERTESTREEARLFVSQVAHLGYKKGTGGLLQMASAAVRFHPLKNRRRQLHAEAIILSESIAELEVELDRGLFKGVHLETLTDDLRRALHRRDKALKLLAETERPAFFENLPDSPEETSSDGNRNSFRVDQNLEDRGGFFCSELVAALYQRLGLLDAPFPSSTDYIPADFAHSLEQQKNGQGVGQNSVEVGTGPVPASGTGVVAGKGVALPRRLTVQLPNGGRMALMRGAKLGPGEWLRGGPRAGAGFGKVGDGGGSSGGLDGKEGAKHVLG
ncbi:unnamed protein product, partial [Discosporangium mesarthrocarpum]